jgi:hypothetical protein
MVNFTELNNRNPHIILSSYWALSQYRSHIIGPETPISPYSKSTMYYLIQVPCLHWGYHTMLQDIPTLHSNSEPPPAFSTTTQNSLDFLVEFELAISNYPCPPFSGLNTYSLLSSSRKTGLQRSQASK